MRQVKVTNLETENANFTQAVMKRVVPWAILPLAQSLRNQGGRNNVFSFNLRRMVILVQKKEKNERNHCSRTTTTMTAICSRQHIKKVKEMRNVQDAKL